MKIASLFLEQGGNSFTIEPHLAVFRGFEDLEEEGKESVIDPYQYESNDVAFDVACRSFKRLISEGN